MNSRKIFAWCVIIIIVAVGGVLSAKAYLSSKTQQGITKGPVATTSPDNSGPFEENTLTASTTTYQNIIITQTDNNKTIRMHVGDEFLLKLSALDWTLSISNPQIIERIKNLAMVNDAQGMFTAVKSGTTDISAEGRPQCDPGAVCPQSIVSFKVTINVDSQ